MGIKRGHSKTPKLAEALGRQLKLNERKNLFHSQVEQLIEIDPIFLAALEELLNMPEARLADFDLAGVAADAAASLIDRIYAINQYIRIDARARESLVDIYTQSWRKLAESKDIESTLRKWHYPRIKDYLSNLYPQTLKATLQSAPTLNCVPCSEYSSQLQMHLFRLDLANLMEPVLDIGCGSQANLVHHLRSQHVEAFGIDRVIKHDSDFIKRADWFELQFGLNKWGTIISNLSFTNHLVYVQRYEPSGVPQYLKKYTEILGSLAPGGSFLNAPGVEILEDQTDKNEFKIEKWWISPQHAVTKATRR